MAFKYAENQTLFKNLEDYEEYLKKNGDNVFIKYNLKDVNQIDYRLNIQKKDLFLEVTNYKEA